MNRFETTRKTLAPAARRVRLLPILALACAALLALAPAASAEPGVTTAAQQGEATGAVCAQNDLSLPQPVFLTSSPGCEDCTSGENFCTQGTQVCNNYCQQLVGENGFCNSQCGCCICPDVQGGGDPIWGDGGGNLCQPVCRCDGQGGSQGLCPSGCRQVNCI